MWPRAVAVGATGLLVLVNLYGPFGEARGPGLLTALGRALVTGLLTFVVVRAAARRSTRASSRSCSRSMVATRLGARCLDRSTSRRAGCSRPNERSQLHRLVLPALPAGDLRQPRQSPTASGSSTGSPTAERAPPRRRRPIRPAPLDSQRAHPRPRFLLEVVVFCVGMASLGAEIAAARLLAPWFGASTIVWANTIATVLVALSIGYAIGGRLADRNPTIQGLVPLGALAAAALLALVPFVSGPFLRLSVQRLRPALRRPVRRLAARRRRADRRAGAAARHGLAVRRAPEGRPGRRRRPRRRTPLRDRHDRLADRHLRSRRCC